MKIENSDIELQQSNCREHDRDIISKWKC